MEELGINTAQVRDKLVRFLKEETKKRSFNRCVLGLSGGVDSAVVATLASLALGPENVLGVFMPYVRVEEDLKDARKLVEKTGIRFKTVDIAPMINAYFKGFPAADRVRRGNKMARERMAVLFDLFKDFAALVLGTGNRTEMLLGYFTLYGDSACALNPIGALYKTQVWQLAGAVGVPRSIIEKKPSARLWPGQTDEDELGITYREADRLLHYMVDRKFPKERLLKLGFSAGLIDRIRALMKNSAFKKSPPLIAQI
jgi:NAD+ synthase